MHDGTPAQRGDGPLRRELRSSAAVAGSTFLLCGVTVALLALLTQFLR